MRQPCVVLVLAFASLMASVRPVAAQDDLINPDRPGIADGSTVVGKGRVQLETAWQYQVQDSDGERSRLAFVPTLLRVGLSRTVEARIEGNTFSHQSVGPPNPSDASGFAALSAGLKYQAIDAEGARPSVGIIARVFPPSGTGDFRSTHTQWDVRAVADWKITDQWSLNPNAGVGRVEGDSGEIFSAGLYAVTLNYQPTDRINPFVDVGAQVPGAPGERASVIFDWGLAWILGRNVQLDASVGHRIRGTAPHPFIAVGFSIRGGRRT